LGEEPVHPQNISLPLAFANWLHNPLKTGSFMSALALAAEMVKQFEGCRLAAYQDPVGVWTIGWGHTGPDVHPGMRWIQRDADNALIADLARASDAVVRLKRRLLTDHQMAALISFTFNLGPDALAKSTLLKLVNDAALAAAADEFGRWDHAGGRVLPGLTARRAAERAMFLTSDRATA
jgi:lysozyme